MSPNNRLLRPRAERAVAGADAGPFGDTPLVLVKVAL
jgi:hypothetical protein